MQAVHTTPGGAGKIAAFAPSAFSISGLPALRPLAPRLLMHAPQHNRIWQALRDCRRELATHTLRDLFEQAPDRGRCMRVSACGLTLDFSKNLLRDKELALLGALAEASGLGERIEAMFSGQHINGTEDRAVLHVALRSEPHARWMADGTDVAAEVSGVRARMDDFARRVRGEHWRGYDGRPITDVVNIGIGGSDLGPAMVCEALRERGRAGPRVHFVSNVDGVQLGDVLAGCTPATTLFVVVSKTFTTQETLANARAARAWLLAQAGAADAVAHHFVAVSTNAQAVQAFGIDPENMFGFWEWVGGRFSLWSAVGLSILLALGPARFDALLAGARAMDEHFRSTPFTRNLPVLMALTGIWNASFLEVPSQLIAPYHQRLHRLPAWLQQLEMESNGKSVRENGTAVDYPTSPVVWGEQGINGQHAYFQLLHQGTQTVAVDFIGVLEPGDEDPALHRIAFANMVAQSEALMRGRTCAEARAEMQAAGLSAARIDALVPHRSFPGNRPSNTLLLDRLNARTLGALLAAYEHRCFVQGVIWGINSFDQWGVELGKQLAARVLAELDPATAPPRTDQHDSSTLALIELYRSRPSR